MFILPLLVFSKRFIEANDGCIITPALIADFLSSLNKPEDQLRFPALLLLLLFREYFFQLSLLLGAEPADGACGVILFAAALPALIRS